MVNCIEPSPLVSIPWTGNSLALFARATTAKVKSNKTDSRNGHTHKDDPPGQEDRLPSTKDLGNHRILQILNRAVKPGASVIKPFLPVMEQHALKDVNNSLYTNIYSYLETSGGISYNSYLNVVHSFNTRVN